MVFHFLQTVFLFVILSLLQLRKIESKLSSMTSHQQIFYSNMDTTICRTIPGLTKFQKKICYEQPDAVLAAMQGLQQAVQECQFQFHDYRWNCSSLATRTHNPYNSAILKKGFKETAYAHAITSAGITLAIARGCSSGMIANCGCDSKIYKIRKPRMELMPKTAFKWGGCSHNIRYGNRFSKLFLDSREKAGDIHSKINLHNNQVGRKMVSSNMEIKCKCHGMSGSCELKTCWRAVPEMRVIGNTLREKFKTAILVDQLNLGKKSRQINMINSKKKKYQNKRTTQWSPRKNNKRKKDLVLDLLYYETSPNFCENSTSLDVSGTAGRLCNRTSKGYDNCESLCCGRGYNLIKKRIVERCNCTFIWCCEVKCDTCSHEEWISVCK